MSFTEPNSTTYKFYAEAERKSTFIAKWPLTISVAFILSIIFMALIFNISEALKQENFDTSNFYVPYRLR